jgi:hypothetical protein
MEVPIQRVTLHTPSPDGGPGSVSRHKLQRWSSVSTSVCASSASVPSLGQRLIAPVWRYACRYEHFGLES